MDLPRLRRLAAAIPIDGAAFVAIAIVVISVRAPFAHYGMPFNDASWYFHFGRRALHGDVPYRDYIFQVGPLPIYVDAAFQRVFGSTYTASDYAGIFVHVLRVFVVWMLVRRLAGGRCAALACVFVALDEANGFAHHWSWSYAELFISLSALFLIMGMRSSERRALVHFALAGLSAGLVVSSRQATVVTLALVLLVTTVAMLWRGQLDRRRAIALWLGFAAAFVIVFGALALAGAAGAGFQQMFLDAPQKKNVTGLIAALDAITGGTINNGEPWWTGLLRFTLLPATLIAGLMWLAARHGATSIAARTIAAIGIAAAIVVGLVTRDANIDFFLDVPRILFTVVTTLAILWPSRLERWFGVEPLVAIALVGLPLASDWALQMSLPGRGWDDFPALALGVLLFPLASAHVRANVKVTLCAIFATLALLHFGLRLNADWNPFENLEATDGTLSENAFVDSHPALADHRIPQARQRALAWLRSQVPPGSTCFMYGVMPVLYDLVDCRNPTRLDVTIPDFMTAADVAQTIAILRDHPPDFLLAHDLAWMNPPISLDLGGQPWGGLNPAAAKSLQVGLHSLLDRYESLGLVSDGIGPELAAQAGQWTHWDQLQGLHVYRRRQ